MSTTHHAVVLAATLLFASCDRPPAEPLHEHGHSASFSAVGGPASDLLKQVRQATARFHSVEQAIAAGYVPTDHCVSDPVLGGMGMHWINPNLRDALFEPERPEVLLYEPRRNGQPKLVAVEYVVLDRGQARPEFDGHRFDTRGTPLPLPHWSLHVWLYRENPEGIFTPFNPTVSCG